MKPRATSSDDAPNGSGPSESDSPSIVESLSVESLSVDLHRSFLDGSPDALFAVDRRGIIAFASAKCVDLFGWQPDELIGRPIEILLPEALATAHVRLREGYADSPRARSMGAGRVLSGRHRDGTVVPIDVSLSPVVHTSKQYVVAAVRHAGPRLETERALRTTTRLFEAIPDAVFAFDAHDFRIVQLNGGARRMLHGRDMRGIPFNSLLAHPEPDLLTTLLAPLLAGDVAKVEFEAELLGSERSIPVDLIVQQLDYGTETPQCLAVARDVTEHQRLEADLRRAQTNLALGDERDRIARDLHDGVIQHLYAAGLRLQTIGDDTPRKVVDAVLDQIDAAIVDVRSTIFALHRPRGLDAGIAEAIRITIAEAERILGHSPKLTITGPSDTMPDDLASDIVDALREMLSNIAKHANAQHTEVELHVSEHDVLLCVRDDGKGCGDIHELGGGQGMHNLRERALRWHGSVSIRDRPTGGCEAKWYARW